MPAEDSRRRVNRTGTPNSHGQLRARKAVTQKHRAGSIMFGSRQQGHQGRFAGFELGSFGGSKPWPGRSGTPPVPRPPNCTGAARARSRDHATSKPGGDGKEREREKRLLVRPAASRSPPAPGGCWAPRHAARPRTRCAAHTPARVPQHARARATRPHRTHAPARPRRPHRQRAPLARPRTPAPARAPQSLDGSSPSIVIVGGFYSEVALRNERQRAQCILNTS